MAAIFSISSVASASMTSMASSTVMMPTRRSSLSTTGRAMKSYFEKVWATSSLSSRVPTEMTCVSMISSMISSSSERRIVRRETMPSSLRAGSHHIADVDGLLVRAGAADALEGVLHRHVSLEVDELRRHQRAGGILGIFQDLIDALAGVGVGVLQNALDHARGISRRYRRASSRYRFVEHLLELGVGKAADEHFLHIRLQLDEPAPPPAPWAAGGTAAAASPRADRRTGLRYRRAPARLKCRAAPYTAFGGSSPLFSPAARHGVLQNRSCAVPPFSKADRRGPRVKKARRPSSGTKAAGATMIKIALCDLPYRSSFSITRR